MVERDAVRELLQQSADALNAAGLIVWLADDSGETLRPGLVHGYSDRILAHLPAVTRDADNATAAAFRTARSCEVAATAHTSGALVVPLLVPDGCAGVLAIELQQGVRTSRSLRAVAVLVAAALTQLVHRSRPVERPAPVEQPAPGVAPVPSGGAADEGQALGSRAQAAVRLTLARMKNPLRLTIALSSVAAAWLSLAAPWPRRRAKASSPSC